MDKVFFPLLLMLAAATAEADVVVVTAANSAVAELSKSQVADIFLGKTGVFPDGGNATPVDLPGDSPVREQFYQAVVGKSAAQVKSHWAKMSFTGKGIPPKESAGSDAVKKLVAATPGTVGYIEKADVDASVKVLFHAE